MNADSYLAYWDIVRNYYSYSQYPYFSIAWPGVLRVVSSESVGNFNSQFAFGDGIDNVYFNQSYCDLTYLDYYYESQFYPGAVASDMNVYNRSSLFVSILNSQITQSDEGGLKGYADIEIPDLQTAKLSLTDDYPVSSFSTNRSNNVFTLLDAFCFAHPMAVCPSAIAA